MYCVKHYIYWFVWLVCGLFAFKWSFSVHWHKDTFENKCILFNYSYGNKEYPPLRQHTFGSVVLNGHVYVMVFCLFVCS